MNSLSYLQHSRLPSAQSFLKRLSQESQQPKIKAWALYALAGSLRQATPGKPSAASIEVLEQMKRDYGHLEHNGNLISAICEAEMHFSGLVTVLRVGTGHSGGRQAEGCAQPQPHAIGHLRRYLLIDRTVAG